MAISYYKGYDTYAIYAEDTAYTDAGAGTPVAANAITKLQTVTVNMNNNMFRTNGLGDGRNATSGVLGGFDVSGTMEGFVDDPSWMQYVVGVRSGAGTVADPYELQEREGLGYDALCVKTITVELGSEGCNNDSTLTLVNTAFSQLTINFNEGEALGFSSEFTSRTVSTGTTLETYTGSTTRPFVMVNGSFTIGGEAFGAISASVTLNNNLNTWRDIGSRFLSQPVFGLRRYDFSFTFKLKFDNTASTLSGLELRDYFFGASGAPASATSITAYPIVWECNEGSASGDRVFRIELENCFFETWGQPMPLEGGAFEVSVEGWALSGLTDGSDKVPIRWWALP